MHLRLLPHTAALRAFTRQAPRKHFQFQVRCRFNTHLRWSRRSRPTAGIQDGNQKQNCPEQTYRQETQDNKPSKVLGQCVFFSLRARMCLSVFGCITALPILLFQPSAVIDAIFNKAVSSLDASVDAGECVCWICGPPELFKLPLARNWPVIPLVTAVNTNTNTEVAIRTAELYRILQEMHYIPYYNVCQHGNIDTIAVLWKDMGVHLVVMGNGGFPPLQWLGNSMDTGRKIGVCGGKCNIEMETRYSPIHGSAMILNILIMMIKINVHPELLIWYSNHTILSVEVKLTLIVIPSQSWERTVPYMDWL